MNIDVTMDYLRVSGLQIEAKLAEIAIENTGSMQRPQYGYEKCYELATDSGNVCGHFMTGRSGELAQFSGKGLEIIRNSGVTDVDMLSALKKTNATRLDVAVDVVNGGNTESILDIIYQYLEQGKVKTLAREFGRYQSTHGDVTGTTVYIGSRKSERFFRAYNKGVESESELSQWVRFELECKAGQAKITHKMILEQGVAKTARVQMEDFAQMEGVYTQAMNELENGVLWRVPRNESKDLVFFEKVIIPYLKTRVNQLNSFHIAQLELIIGQWNEVAK